MKAIAFLLVSCCFTLFSYADPCPAIEEITCGNTYSFSVTGLGDPAYPYGMNGQGCGSPAAQGGQEKVYRFVVPTTGTYQLNSISISTSDVVAFYYKRNNTTCDNTGWTCIRENTLDNSSLGAFAWNAGDVILLLLNSENTSNTTQTFSISCATNVCDAITSVACGETVTFSAFGFGDPAYPYGMNGQGCGSPAAQGGQEKVYRFVVPTTGTYQLNSISISTSDVVAFYYKRNNATCNNTGWTCIRENTLDNSSLGAFAWNAGDVILLLLNSENTSNTTQTFSISCATNVCDAITSITCGETVTFSAFGFGDPAYPYGMNGQGCGSPAAQGGQEKVYRFVVPTTGTYQLNSISITTSDVVAFYYKRNNATCNNTGWTCIRENTLDNSSLGAFSWNAGDTILLLLNAENTTNTTQTFSISCATNVCDAITSITCGETVTFSAFGFGDPAYPYGMNGQGCGSPAAQGGQEKVYRFVVPTTGTYQLNSISISTSDVVAFYYKRNNATCNNTGWTCIRENTLDNSSLGAFAWNAGDVILLLLNAENTSNTTQIFSISCATNVCDAITSIACGETVTFTAFGLGDPAYPYGMNGQGCGSPAAQGGQEKVYRFMVPTTGTYQLNSISITTSDVVAFYYKRNNTTCDNTGWTCIRENASDNSLLGAFSWNAGDIILLLLNAENTTNTTQTFSINCPGTMPLTLLSLNVLNTESTGNKLYWTTVSEVNTDYFNVEHSANGRDFTVLGRVNASTNSVTKLQYEFTDHSPDKGMNYYRLQMIDKDGKFTYSKVIAISLANKSSLIVYPNPVNDELFIQLHNNSPALVIFHITDLQGRILTRETKQLNRGLNALSFNTSGLPGGKYMLVINGQQTRQKLFVKQ